MALTRPTTSPGNASSIVSRSWPNTECAYLVANGLPVRPWVTTMPRSKRPEHTRRNAMRSRCDGVHVGLHLEHEAGERRVERSRLARRRPSRGVGAGARSTTASSSSRTPKFVSAEPKNTGVDSPARNARRRGRRRPRRAARARRCAVVHASPSSAAAALGGRRPPRAPRWRRGRRG